MKSHSPIPGMGEGNTFAKGNLYPAFRQKGREKNSPVSAVPQLPSVKNNLNINVAYFGVAYADPLQIHTRKERLTLGKLCWQPSN